MGDYMKAREHGKGFRGSFSSSAGFGEKLRSIYEALHFVLIRNKRGRLGLILLSIPLAMALAPQIIAPYDPWIRVGRPFEPPSYEHWLGTNDIGQDIFSELVYGARISLFVGFIAAISTVLLGTVVGVVAGYFRGMADDAITSVIDTMMLVPVLPFMVLLAAFLGQGYQNIILVITIFAWPGIARLVRAEVRSIRESLYVETARALGASHARIMFKHILPQLTPLLVAFVMLRVGSSMIAEASLSFLGFGDPTQKSWGTMIYWAMRSGAITSGAWWWITFPGIMITLCVLAFAQIGYALEEYANPRLREMV